MHAFILLCLTTFPASGPPQDPVLLQKNWNLPHAGTQIQEQRLLDPSTGRIRSEARLPDGSSVDLASWLWENQKNKVEASGRISHELAEKMAAAENDQPMHVVFWLKADQAPDFRQMLMEAEAGGMTGEDARRFARDQAQAYFADGNQAFAAKLQQADLQVTQIAGPWPNVFALVPPSQIATWAKDPAVDMVYFVFPEWFHELDDAANTMRTHLVWDRGISGNGSPVKVMVNDVGDVISNNPYLPPITYLSNIGSHYHATAVAGNIAMDHSSYRASAAGLPTLYSGGGSGDSGAPPIWNSAISAGVSFGNCSWWNGSKGSIVYLDRFFDYTLRQFAVMMFKSTGNQGNSSTPYTTTPGNGYNSTNSGCYSDRNTMAWSDDVMASYSSYWDPVEGHEKPELANCGDGVDTASEGGSWIYGGFSGTSSASPLTCGVATLMATRDNALMTRPEAVKCILMASAWHNIEGNEVLSEYDGAGGVHAAAADAVCRDGQYVHTSITAASFQGGVYDLNFQAYAGDETRVCALWFSKANSAYTTDFLEMDLDMSILDPNQNVVATSASALNPFEIVQFIPPTTGTYTVRLSNIRFDGSSENLAVAWCSRMDAAEGTVGMTGQPKIGDTVTMHWDQRYHPNAFFQAHASFGSLPNTVDLGGGFVLPLAADAVYTKTGNMPASSGTLNGSGAADSVVVLPNNPGLVGRQMHVAFYTQDNAVSPVETTSEPFSFTFTN